MSDQYQEALESWLMRSTDHCFHCGSSEHTREEKEGGYEWSCDQCNFSVLVR